MSVTLGGRSVGLCGWCVYHKLLWQEPPIGPGTTWPLTCALDDVATQSYGTCASWTNILESVPLNQLQHSAHEWAELLRVKCETFRLDAPDRESLGGDLHHDRLPP